MSENSSLCLSEKLSIGTVQVDNRAFLAPMSGVTDVPFRSLAARYGAGLVVSEMIASQALLEGEAEMQIKLLKSDSPIHMVQIAGRETRWMELAAKLARDSGADIIDINMGCPARRVTTGLSGSALMRDLDHALSLIDATVKAVEIPVTLKMRLGWDDNSKNAPELARRATEAGVQMITVHGRTRCQFYKGKADWEAVSAVREQTRLPLVVNGDIYSKATAQTALAKSGADAVMIGRGSYGAPWKAGQIAGNIEMQNATFLATDAEVALSHHQEILSFYGKEAGIRQARKHLSWYLSNLDLPISARDLRGKALTSFDPSEIDETVRQLYQIANSSSSHERVAA